MLMSNVREFDTPLTPYKRIQNTLYVFTSQVFHTRLDYYGFRSTAVLASHRQMKAGAFIASGTDAGPANMCWSERRSLG